MRPRFRSILFLLPLLLLISSVERADAQKGVPFIGSVVDDQTGEPLIGATVALSHDGRRSGAVTGRDGGFRIASVEPGEYDIRVSYVGYMTATMHVVVGAEMGRQTFRLQESPATLNPVEIIGQSPTMNRRVPGTVTLVDARAVAMIMPLGTQELLSHVPGINGFADDGMGNSRISVGMRGLNPRRSSRVLILEDGIPIEPAPYVYPNMYYNPPAERLDRVEVIKGSGALRYGPQTMGGVINYITERPKGGFGGSAAVTGGMNGYLSLYSELNGFGSNVVQPQLQLLYKRGDGFRENNGFQQGNATLKMNIIPDEDKILYVKFNADYEKTNATYTGLTEYSFETDPRFNPKKDDEFTVVRGALDLIYTDKLSEVTQSTTRAYLSYFDRNWWRENDVFVRPGASDTGAVVAVPYYEAGNLVRTGNRSDNYGNLRTFYTVGAEQEYSVEHGIAGIDATLDAGARLHFERFLDRHVAGNAPDARSGIYYTIDPLDSTITLLGKNQTYETTALSLFMIEKLDLDALTITPGIRIEIFEQERINRLQGAVYEDKSSIVVLPGLGFNYEIDAFNIFGGIHRGYTPPTDGTLSIVNFGKDAGAGGLSVESEKSWNSELGVRAAAWFGTFEVAGFNLMIEDMVAPARGATFDNLGRVSSSGVEFAATVRGSRFEEYLPDLNILYTYLDTRVIDGTIKSAVIAGDVPVDVSGNELPYAPHHTFSAGLAMDLPFGLAWRFDINHVGRVYTDLENIERTYNRGDTGPVEAHTIVDASASYRLPAGLTAGVSAKNIFDLKYIGSRLHSSPSQPEANLSSGILPGPGRQVNVSLTWKFGS
jgi:Fe(3+) dicitrate transport protein